MNKAAFFDRDGTINIKDSGYLYECEKLEFVDGVPELIRKYNQDGYLVIVVTNQGGIAKGYYTESDVKKLHCYMNEVLEERWGARIDAFYFCPHHPEITGVCDCRKPASGMIEQAIGDYDIDVSQSVLYGDKQTDIEAGGKCGIKGILVEENGCAGGEK